MFNKILVANRGEIAIRIFRAATELKIRTVAIYTYEDRYSLHRYKADESYQIGSESEPLKPYLDMNEIIHVALREHVDAIHPGYGFLSENDEFAEKCRNAGIVFIGPRPETMRMLGDKIRAKIVAKKVGVPCIEDSKVELTTVDLALKEANDIGYPVIIKAAGGGGGRGMRVAHDPPALKKLFGEAKAEAKVAFGNDEVFLEKYIISPKHIEVQILGDNFGNLVHLFERDCSVQRRFQKVVEVAPAVALDQQTKNKLYEYALKICKEVDLNNASTVEFLVDQHGNIYFIEVNPRIQVEHTVTEAVTRLDIVKSQILIAMGFRLDSKEINIRSQEEIVSYGVAIQSRITTEDASNGFKPDFGTIIAYRNAGGPGIRLDEGNAYPSAVISPFFDSLLVKITSQGRNMRESSDRMVRVLKEFRIRGVKTNVNFLENVLTNLVFLEGKATVDFIDNNPALFNFEKRFDRGTNALKYLGEIIVNGNSDVRKENPDIKFRHPVVPEYDPYAAFPEGSRDKLKKLGREKFVSWIKDQKPVLITDCTMRDAHQSLLATRVRTIDLVRAAEAYAKRNPNVFSLEMWGGATFDVALRFLKESPWHRLKLLRDKIPNILFQMLIRGSNAVGYKAYPDNLVERFIEESWKSGIDIFRIFDSLNWIEGMRVSIKAVNESTEALSEACICYTGDFLDPEKNKKFNLNYYLDLAKNLEDAGTHILGIKDMSGLLKPYQAEILISELKKAIDIPIHLHTHDTAGIQSATYLKAIDAGVDIVDVALASMSGLTSQPNFNSMAAILKGQERDPGMDIHALNEFSNYWETIREYYYPFESELKAGTAEVYDHEIPGGQYSNLRPQARSLGLEDKFETIKENYVIVNDMFGDIVKVTPSSKVVGDMALFMTANGYTREDIMSKGNEISFPDSVIELFRGDLGQNPGGFPPELSKIILKNQEPFTDHPNAHLEPVDFEKEFDEFHAKFDATHDFHDFLSYKFYPKVFEQYAAHLKEFGDVYYLPTPAFFYKLKHNEEIIIELAPGKNILVYLMHEIDEIEGTRTVYFRLNGQTRPVVVKIKNFQFLKPQRRKADKENEIGSPLPGRISKILVKEGDKVKKSAHLFTIEAMKMENTVLALKDCVIGKIYLKDGDLLEQDDLVMEVRE